MREASMPRYLTYAVLAVAVWGGALVLAVRISEGFDANILGF